MLDNKTLKRWIEYRARLIRTNGDLNIEGSQIRDVDHEVAATIFTAAKYVGVAVKLLDRALLRAGAESPTYVGELVGEKGAK